MQDLGPEWCHCQAEAKSGAWCRIRDLNDVINKLVREKGHWERRIRELGGPDYARNAPKATDSEGRELEGASGKGAGYRYINFVQNERTRSKDRS